MKSRWNSLVTGGCNVIGMTLLALSVTAGGSAVRAAGDSPVLDSAALEPLMKLADVFSQRIARIEASVAAYTESLTTRRVATQELCVADDTGARTCISKAQLDALLKGLMQTAQAAPAIEAAPAPEVSQAARTDAPDAAAPVAERPVHEAQAACPEKCVPPESALAGAPVPAAGVNEAVSATETAAPEAAKQATPAGEAPAAPPAPAAEQHATADAPAAPETAAPSSHGTDSSADENAGQKAAEKFVGSPAEAPTGSVLANAAKPEALRQAQTSATPADPAPAQVGTTGAAAQEPAAEAAAEHKE